MYINSPKKITDEDEIEIISHIWTPDAKYNFPTVDHGKFKRTFQLKWLDLFQWLAYSNNKNGSFCKFCVLFLNSYHVRKGLNTAVGTLVVRPHTNLKNALDTFRNHEKTNYHQSAFQIAENIMSILNKKKDSIIIQLDTKRVKDTSVNRAKLKPIIQTIRFCGRQQIASRRHEDWGRITMDEPDKNDGNFRSLLRYRANSSAATSTRAAGAMPWRTASIPILWPLFIIFTIFNFYIPNNTYCIVIICDNCVYCVR